MLRINKNTLDELFPIHYAPDTEDPGDDEDDETLVEDKDLDEEVVELDEDGNEIPGSDETPGEKSDTDESNTPIGEDDKIYVSDPETGETVEVTGKELSGYLTLKSKQGTMATELEKARKTAETSTESVKTLDAINTRWDANPTEYIHGLVNHLKQNGHDIRLVVANKDDGDYYDYQPSKVTADPGLLKELEAKDSKIAEYEIEKLADEELGKFNLQHQKANVKYGEALTPGIHKAMSMIWANSDDQEFDYEKVLKETFGLSVAKKVPSKNDKDGDSKGGAPRKPQRQTGDSELTRAEKAAKKLGYK